MTKMKKIISILMTLTILSTVCAGVDFSAYAASKAKSITLSAYSYTYNGKVRKPSVTAKDKKGKKISSKYYKVTYASGRKNVGKYKVTVKFKGKYTGTLSKYFTIKPKGTSLGTLTADVGKVTVKWTKLTTQTTGYQIQYSTSSKFSNAKLVTISKNTTTSKLISSLAQNKKYYFRVRTYKTVSGTKYYSAWSKAKSITTKFKLNITTTTYTLYNSESLDLYVTGGSGTVTWSSSDPSVAPVNADGKVIALKAGTATITAKRGSATAKCIINVPKMAPENDYVPDFGAYTGLLVADYYYEDGVCANMYYATSDQWSDYVTALQENYSFEVVSVKEAADNEGVAEIVLNHAVGGYTVTVVVDYNVAEKAVVVAYEDFNGYNSSSVHKLNSQKPVNGNLIK